MKEPCAVDWLLKMKDAQVICLGSWPGSTKSHTEVESIEFLEGLANSKDLRFLSLQGGSRINKLPESIGNHRNLMILDLKECYNLEKLGEKVLRKLIIAWGANPNKGSKTKDSKNAKQPNK
ncbi:hypothetical protein CFP56_005259 [Quercus suber]|uniref:Uncharacterized protein n=1 Tax=Quercus suber TaxID=58331 RepID=A0AAW0IGM3_QUESU